MFLTQPSRYFQIDGARYFQIDGARRSAVMYKYGLTMALFFTKIKPSIFERTNHILPTFSEFIKGTFSMQQYECDSFIKDKAELT